MRFRSIRKHLSFRRLKNILSPTPAITVEETRARAGKSGGKRTRPLTLQVEALETRVAPTIALVQTIGSATTAAGNSLTITPTATVTSGNSIIISMVFDDPGFDVIVDVADTFTATSSPNLYGVDTTGVTDFTSNTPTGADPTDYHPFQVDTQVGGGIGSVRTVILSAHNITHLPDNCGEIVIRMFDPGTMLPYTPTLWAAIAHEFKGIGPAPTDDALDQTETGSGFSAYASTPVTPLTAQRDELIFGAFGFFGEDDFGFIAGSTASPVPGGGSALLPNGPGYARITDEFVPIPGANIGNWITPEIFVTNTQYLEDTDRDDVLDQGEDFDGNGILTPGFLAAGTIVDNNDPNQPTGAPWAGAIATYKGTGVIRGQVFQSVTTGTVNNPPLPGWTVTRNDGFNPPQVTTTDEHGEYYFKVNVNNDGPAYVFIDDVVHAEGNAGTTDYSFTVRLNRAFNFPITVDYVTLDDTATDPPDYNFATGTIVFPPGVTSVTMDGLFGNPPPITVNGDNDFGTAISGADDQGDELFEVFLFNPTPGASVIVADDTGVGYIQNDDGVKIYVNDVMMAEGGSGGSLTFNVNLNFASPLPVTVTFNLNNNTAIDSGLAPDYVDIPATTLTFAPGTVTLPVAVTINGDGNLETTEFFTIDLSAPTNAIIGDAQGRGILLDDDGGEAAQFYITDVTKEETAVGPNQFAFTVGLSNPSAATATVAYTTANGTATSGSSDYNALATSLVLPANAFTGTLNITVNGDTTMEDDEDFFVNISQFGADPPIGDLDGDTIDDFGTGLILNDDGPNEILITDVSLAEGNSGTKIFTFSVLMSFPHTQTVTVDYVTTNGGAVGAPAGGDYTVIPVPPATPPTLTFTGGLTLLTVDVTVNGDTTFEDGFGLVNIFTGLGYEDFEVSLFNVTGAVLADTEGEGFIINDDFFPASFTATPPPGEPLGAGLGWVQTLQADTFTVCTNFEEFPPGTITPCWLSPPLPPVNTNFSFAWDEGLQDTFLSGQVWEDLDGDGVKDRGEPGLNGWPVHLYKDTDLSGGFSTGDALIQTTVSATFVGAGSSHEDDFDGYYTFQFLTSGQQGDKYFVVEDVAPGWSQTEPFFPVTYYTVDGSNPGGGVNMPDRDFGNFHNITISGIKFNDRNADGAFGGLDVPLDNWTIFIDLNGNGELDPGEPSTLTATEVDTNLNGVFDRSEDYLGNGFGGNGNGNAKLDQNEDANGNCVLDPGEDLDGNHTLNYPENTFLQDGFFFPGSCILDIGEDLDGDNILDLSEDFNGNGLLDRNEDLNNNNVQDSGVWVFANLGPNPLGPGPNTGTPYRIREVLQTGWAQTTGNLNLVPCSNHSVTTNFGNSELVEPVTITGRKFNDIDGDGVYDAGEDPPLEGWVIQLRIDDTPGTPGIIVPNGIYEPIEEDIVVDAFTTGISGTYGFITGPGRYWLREVAQTGWTQTQGDYYLITQSGEVHQDNDFGNFQNVTITGRKFEDFDGDGVDDGTSSEPGLPGFTIALYKDDPFNGQVGTLDAGDSLLGTATTDFAGNYTFPDVPNGRFFVQEIMPTDPNLIPLWRPTLPAEAAFGVILNAKPTGTVTVTLASSNTSEGQISALPGAPPVTPTITFDPTNYNTLQRVVVTGQEDVVLDPFAPYTVTATAVGGGYAGQSDSSAVTNVDDDTPRLVITSNGTLTTERGDPTWFEVALTMQPSASTTFAVSSSNVLEGVVTPATLTFSQNDWFIPQRVKVTGVADAAVDGNIAYIANIDWLSGDATYNFNGGAEGTVALTNIDDESPGITVTSSTGPLTTSETGEQFVYQVRLNAPPNGTVVMSAVSSNLAEGSVSPATLTFTPSNWFLYQTVSVSGVNDFTLDGDIGYTVTVAYNSGASNYSAVAPAVNGLTNVDDETVAVRIVPLVGATYERGNTPGFYTIDTRSGIPVSEASGIKFHDLDRDGILDGGETSPHLHFGNAQPNTISGRKFNDLAQDGTDNNGTDPSLTAWIIYLDGTNGQPNDGILNSVGGLSDNVCDFNALEICTQTDGNGFYYFRNLPVGTYTVREVIPSGWAQTLPAAIIVTPTSGLTTSESPSANTPTATFTVVLATAPTANVTVPISSSNTLTGGTASVASLLFTPVNWFIPQTVTVTGANDAALGNVAYTILTGAATSTDTDYNTVDAPDVSVTNLDNDTVGITVTRTSRRLNPTGELITAEWGMTATFTAVLNSAPTADVCLPISSSDLSEATVSFATGACGAGQLTFTSGNWFAPQTVTLTGIQDVLVDGIIGYTAVIGPATSGDLAYNAVDPADLLVVNMDDETPGITNTLMSGSTSESGTTASFEIFLNAPPTSDVAFRFGTSNTPEANMATATGAATTTTRTFTSLDWFIPQTVSVIGEDDIFVDGDQPFTVLAQTIATITIDPNYSVLTPLVVATTYQLGPLENLDNDGLPSRFYSVTFPAGNPTTANNITGVDKDFGNFQYGIISGTKFHDADGNSIQSIGEPGLSGWKILLYQDTDQSGGFSTPDTLVATQLTDVFPFIGDYTFSNVSAGRYFVREELQGGWIQTFPAEGGYPVTITSGTVFSPITNNPLDFGNFQKVRISGTKFDDQDGDGVRDLGEPGLAGWVIFLDESGDDILQPAVERWTVTIADNPLTPGVDESGYYEFLDLPPATYPVREVLQTGWQQTLPGAPTNGYDLQAFSGLNWDNQDFGNIQPVSIQIQGQKYNDLDGDGSNEFVDVAPADGSDDDGVVDPGLDGWTIELYKDAFPFNGIFDAVDTLVTSMATPVGGFYNFTVSGTTSAIAGTYFIREVAQPGWTLTQGDYTVTISSANPPEVKLNGTTITGTAINNTNFGNFENITISGRKFEDLDPTVLIENANNPGLSGFSIELYRDANANAALDLGTDVLIGGAITDFLGQYSFSNVGPGTYFVREIIPVAVPAWVQTVPPLPTQHYIINPATSGTDVTSRDFGNYQPSTISGRKFDDRDGDGSDDLGSDPGLVGWTIQLWQENGSAAGLQTSGASTDILFANGTTGPNGVYSFRGLPAGATFYVIEVLQTGWMQTTAPAIHTVAPDGISNFPGRDFGNFKLFSITGQKFNDINGNGTKDVGDVAPPLLVSINLSGAVVTSVLTDVAGNYTIPNLGPGAYTISESVPAGWLQTAPAGGSYTFTAQSGVDITTRDFGNFEMFTISGQKFHDKNGDGVKDPDGIDNITPNSDDEVGLSSWTIFIDTNGDVIFDSDGADNIVGTIDDEPSDTTDGLGDYTLGPLGPGNYVVREVIPAAPPTWIQTLPAGAYNIAGQSGNDVTGRDFGNAQPITLTLTGIKYNDINGDGSRDADGLDNIPGNTDDEIGLPGWTINARRDDGNTIPDAGDTTVGSVVTGAGGAWTITLTGLGPQIGGLYFVQEVLQAGWTNTQSPASVTASAVADTTASNLDFGNFQNITIGGKKFEDLNGGSSNVYSAITGGTDPGLSGWLIRLYKDNGNSVFDAADLLTQSFSTLATGSYAFSNVGPGLYFIAESLQAGWTQTFPTALTPGASAGAPVIAPPTGPLGDVFYTVVATSGTNVISRDFGNIEPITISGHKFNDLDGDGVRDAAEGFLPGWTIFFDANSNNLLDNPVDGNGVCNANATEVCTFTDSTGLYIFRNLAPGTYRVREVLQPAWTQTTTNPADLALVAGDMRVDVDFGNKKNPVLSGVKFRDDDGDGVRDVGEPGLAGWVIQLYADTDNSGGLTVGDVLLATDTTDATGSYDFTVNPGLYFIREVLQVGWVQTTNPTTYIIEAISGTDVPNRDFGNFDLFDITGMKYNDINGDGVRDADGADNIAGNTDDEVGLAGWTIVLDGSAAAVTSPDDPSTPLVDETGQYSFLNVAPGNHTVAEVLQAGWTNTQPGGAASYTFAGVSGTNVIGQDFGNFAEITITGRKFNDLNGNGTDNGGTDPGLAGWTINAVADTNGNGVFDGSDLVAASAVTGAGGAYSITLNAPGTFFLREVTQPGWTQTKGNYTVIVTAGMTVVGRDFGNFENFSISGQKFEDLDADANKEAIEPRLANWQIDLYRENNGNTTLQVPPGGDILVASAITDSTGNYSFLDLGPGRYYVREAASPPNPAGFSQTLGAAGYTIVGASGTNRTERDFGNVAQITVSGTKFNDLNGDGIREVGEPGLQGWNIQLYTSDGDALFEPGTDDIIVTTVATNANGVYIFSGLAAGDYITREVPQAGWTQTAPASPGVHFLNGISATNATTANRDFGNFQTNSIRGAKFNDINGNGARDPGEPGLAGWTILLFNDTDNSGGFTAGDVLFTTATTFSSEDLDGDGVLDAGEDSNGDNILQLDGDYRLSSLAPNEYFLREQQQAGWTQTLGNYNVNLISTALFTGLDFGNFRHVSITGFKFDDFNGDGAWDPDGDDNIAGNADDEDGLLGWTIFLDANGNGTLDPTDPSTTTSTDTSGNSGFYSFSDLGPGTYSIEEVLQTGWAQTLAPGSVTPTSGVDVIDQNFGNFKFFVLTGRKFEDMDGDGTDEGGADPGLGGWTVYVDLNNNFNLDAGEGSVITAADGTYTMNLIGSGATWIREEPQAGWQQTYGEQPAIHYVAVFSGGTKAGVDFGNFERTIVSGRKFEDLDGSGTDNGGTDRGLSGWQIRLWRDEDPDGLSNPLLPNGTLESSCVPGPCDTLLTSILTDFFGNYTFGNIDPGRYFVDEVLITGWAQTFPTAPNHHIIDPISGTPVIGQDFGNFPPINIGGRKFNDLDGDGTDDGGTDPSLAGWTIYLDSDNDNVLDLTEPNTVTDGLGNYAFRNLTAGTYFVREVVQSGWVQTAAPAPVILATSTAVVSGQDFGNYQLAGISGQKFDDLDGDGALDTGEQGLGGWTIFLDGSNGGVINGALDVVETSTVTDASGNYSFSGLVPGTYRVREVQQAGYTQTTVDPAPFTPTSGTTTTGIDFGNFKLISISGQKFQDDNGDTIFNGADAGLNGWTIFLDGSNGGPVNDVLDAGELNTVTATVLGTPGVYSFSNLGPGTYRLREVPQAGWVQTTLNPADIVAQSGSDQTGKDFGNFQLVTISGRKFTDLDGDGTDDGGTDPGLAGVTIQLDIGADAVADVSVVTGAGGTYSFPPVGPGIYRVREVVPAGYTQTTVDPADITTSSGVNVASVDFGNFQLITVSGKKFNDLDGDGTDDGGTDPGLGGWTIFLDADSDNVLDAGELSTTTAVGTGAYTISNVGPGTFAVREVVQAGWLQTTANPGGFTTSSGTNVAGINFGNFQLITISGKKFVDEDGNGLLGGTEPGLQNWTIQLDIGADSIVDQTTSTDISGNYSFQNLGPGVYRVREVLQAGWSQLSANPADITAVSGSNVSGVNFGNFQAPEISITDVTVNEGNAGPTIASFTVSLNHGTLPAAPVTVTFTAANNTATTADNDYVFTTGVLTFLSGGSLTQSVNVTINGDTRFENDETFFVNLSGAGNATIADNQGIGTITNDDPIPTITINDITLAEGNAGTTAFNFTVTLSAASGLPANFTFATANNTAAAPTDFTALAATATSFAPGETVKTITVLVNGDLSFETTETFFVDLSAVGNATFADNQGVGTITNDDAPPIISIADVSAPEGNCASTAFNFTVSLNAPSSVQATVNFSTAAGLALVGSDFAGTSGTLTFAPGETFQLVTVQVVGDDFLEVDENFFVNLSTPTNASIGDTQAIGTILDDNDTGSGASDGKLVSADFNLDGRLDIAYPLSNNVGIRFGNGNGTFGGETLIAGFGNAFALAAADYNSDGRPDLAVVNNKGNSVSVLLGNGGGGFGAATTHLVGIKPVGIVAGHFNADCTPDLGVINQKSNTLSVLIGAGGGAFGAATNYGVGKSPLSIGKGDFNADGNLDFAILNKKSSLGVAGSDVQILQGNGDGTFLSSVFVNTNTNSTALAVSFLNADGQSDLIVANPKLNTTSVLLKTVSSFSGPTNYNVGTGPIALALSDFNGDGKFDLLVANSGSKTISHLAGNGDGTLLAPANFALPDSPIAMVVGDWNGDGFADWLARTKSGILRAGVGNGAGGFTLV